MTWKVFLTAFVSALLIGLPQNVYTCAGGEDPYDYFTSFFSNKAGTSPVYKPFYYTALLTFYDDWSEDSTGYENDAVIKEWMAYSNSPEADVVELVYQSSEKDLLHLKQVQSLPASLVKNLAAKNLLKEKKYDAISYLSFAKKIESISAPSDTWEDKKRDSLTLNKYINEANGQFAKADASFIKTKWAFQRCKLAFYNHRYSDCIRWYDEYFNESNTAAVTQLALSYKAGSQFRLGKNKEAAYSFSKAFPLSDQNKKANFLGFLWATDHCNPELIPEYADQCKNNVEKANMLGMFGMYGMDYRLNRLQDVYKLNPSSPLLPLLATREINKLEEQYLTPLLQDEKNIKPAGLNKNVSAATGSEPVINTAVFLEKLMTDKAVPNRSLYAAGAAYLY